MKTKGLPFLKRKWQKILAIVLLVITVLILILAIFVNRYWSPVLASKVKEVVLKSSDGLYKADFSSAELHVLRGTIDIFNITLKPDTAAYNLEKKNHLAPNNLVELHVKRLTLSHIHPFKLYFQHKLDIGEVALDEPVLNVSYRLNHTRDTVLKDNRTAWQKISKSLKLIHIGKILLGDVKLKYEDYSGNKLAISEFREMNLSAYDLLIDSTTQTDRSRLLYCKEIIAELNDYAAKSPNGLYKYTFSHIKLSTRLHRLNVEGFTLTPVNPVKFFANSYRDRFTVRLDSLQLNNFDFLNYHKYRIFAASSLYLKKGTVQVFGNPDNYIDPIDKIVSFPHVALFKLNTDIKLDTISVRHINVLYDEFNQKSKKTGSISFNNTNGYLLNITTNAQALQKSNISTVQLTSYFMNRGKLDVAFTFNLTDKNNAFSFKGELGPMELKAVNIATMPLTMVKITSGSLKQFSFDIRATGHTDKGKVLVLYNDLKVVLLKTDSAFFNLKRKPIASIFANLFILKHNNPDEPGEQPRAFSVDYVRASKTPFFKSMWQTLLTGIKPAIGLDKQTVDSAKAMINNEALNKQNRKVKKELRKQRRAERRKKREEKKLLKSKEAGG